MPEAKPLVGIIMGSKSDWDTMRPAAELLQQFGVPHECRIVSAHRTPAVDVRLRHKRRKPRPGSDYRRRGGAAHLPGMVAAQTILPVLGVPVQSKTLCGARLAALDRADARRHSGRHARHRYGRS